MTGSTYERWKNARPIRDSLPGINGGYDNAISDWLTDLPDQLVVGSKFRTVDDGARNIDPINCDEQWLDLLAACCGWYGIWDSAWPVPSKRVLLANSFTVIWPNHGNKTALSFVLTALNIDHLIQEGASFLIGRDAVGDPLGEIAWQYEIVLPSNYYNSPQLKLTERINRIFGPAWCESSISFNDEYFAPDGLLALNDSTFILVNQSSTQQTILGL